MAASAQTAFTLPSPPFELPFLPTLSGSWTATIGAEGTYKPDFEGAKASMLSPVPIIYLRRAGSADDFHSPRDNASIALIDFGLSKDAALALDVTDTGTIFGTPHYMSPEQGHAEALDARSDLYSLGVILFEMLTGAKPYRADNPMAIVYKHRKEPLPQLPAQLRAVQPVLERLMAKSPAERFADAQQARAALIETLGGWLTRGRET